MTRRDMMVPLDLDIPAARKERPTASDLVENWEHLQEMITHYPSGKTGKKKMNYYAKQLKRWRTS